jgi:DNA-binding NtrC family response regulator
LTPEVAAAFRRYHWPGNVRELRNVIERALILEDSDLITAAYLPSGIMVTSGKRTAGADLPEDGGREWKFELPVDGLLLEEVESSLVQQAIQQSGGNQTRAAELLGISRDQLRYRLKKLPESREKEDAAAS